MTTIFTSVFVVLLLLMIIVRNWLAWRQVRYVTAHADLVPADFADRISLDAHRKAAQYTIVKTRLGVLDTALSAAILVGLTLLGGLQRISDALVAVLGRGFAYQLALVLTVVVLLSALDLPLAWYRQFRVEQRFGFNRMSIALWWADLAKSAALGLMLGVPLLAVVLWLMERAGDTWWLYAWGVWVAFNAAALALYPTLIAPLFNKFKPLADAGLADRIAGLLTRTGFKNRGVFVMDGSRRSAHGNAYFTGMGRAKRIVFFDTLIERLEVSEIEAVLAHELGHFKRKHITQRLALSFMTSLAMLALLGWLSTRGWFYESLGVTPSLLGSNAGLALVLFMLVLPVFTFALGPLTSQLSRKHEFEADAFAAQHASSKDLVNALVKLYQDNASTLTPDPLHSAFYDSHPPASARIERLLSHVPA